MSNRKNIKKEEINAKNDVNRKGKITYKQMSNGGYSKTKSFVDGLLSPKIVSVIITSVFHFIRVQISFNNS